MGIHKEGYRIISWIWIPLAVILLIINLIFPQQSAVHIILYVLAFLFYLSIIFFFRKPYRTGDTNPNEILSAADGDVMIIEEVHEKEYFGDTRIKVSVFMSLLNIHVNLFPVPGRVKYVKHHPGKHFLAFLEKSSLLNEHQSVVLEAPNGKEIMVRQIAGGVARRIVCYAKEGDIAQQRSEIGIIKFGSRVDLFLPPDTKIIARIDQKSRAGRTVIGYFS